MDGLFPNSLFANITMKYVSKQKFYLNSSHQESTDEECLVPSESLHDILQQQTQQHQQHQQQQSETEESHCSSVNNGIGRLPTNIINYFIILFN